MFTPKNLTLGALLTGIAVVGPLVAYAGVSVVWPASTNTVNVVATPPLQFLKGSDYTQAANLSFLSAWAGTNTNASFTLTVSGLAGGNVTIDKYVNITKNSASLASFKLQVSTALSGTLSNPDVLKIRAWTGSTAPTNDASSGVCAVLDLEAAVNTESTNSCSASVDIQLILELPAAATGSSTVSLRPSSITLS